MQIFNINIDKAINKYLFIIILFLSSCSGGGTKGGTSNNIIATKYTPNYINTQDQNWQSIQQIGNQIKSKSDFSKQWGLDIIDAEYGYGYLHIMA